MRKTAFCLLFLVGILLFLGVFEGNALASFPEKPIELTVVYPAGGGMDVTARILAKYAKSYVGTDLIVINRTGGGGLIGHTYIAKQAKPDGYSLGVLASTIVPDILLKNPPFSIDDIEPITFINETPVTWVARADSKWGKMDPAEIFEYARENPGEINIGVIPDNTFEYTVVGAELNTGVEFTKVSFQGGAPGITALMGGHIDITCAYFSEFQSQYEAGILKPIAVASEVRSPNMPETPTFKELGVDVPTIFGAWRFIAAPVGIPKDRFDYLEKKFMEALKDPELIEAYKEVGIYVGNPYMNSSETKARLHEIYEGMREFFISIGKIE